MPKATYSRILKSDTDADFKQWALDLSTALKACLTQTADTGQVDWSASGSSVINGYSDNFNRANGTYSGIMTVLNGTVTIESNQLRVIGGASLARVVKNGVNNNGILSVKVNSVGLSPLICFRGDGSASNTTLAWDPVGGIIRNFTTATAFTTLTGSTHTPFTPAAGDVLTVTLSDTSIILKQNGTTILSMTSATYQTNTYHGVGEGNNATGSLFDDLSWSPDFRPQTSTGFNGLYEMYRFSDSLQATKPVFIKVEYGTGSTIGQPTVKLTVGTATNGAGTITSQIWTATTGASTPSAVTAATAYVCAKDGYFGMVWGALPTPSAGSPHFHAVIARSRDNTGTITGNGRDIVTHYGASGFGAAAGWSYDLAVNIPPLGGGNCMVPSYLSSTSTQAKVKTYPHRVYTPDEFGITGCVTYMGSEINTYTEFDVAPLPGMSPVHYLALGDNMFGNTVVSNSTWKTAMRYET